MEGVVGPTAGPKLQKPLKRWLSTAHRRGKITGNEPDAKAILPEPWSVQKANSYQFERPRSPSTCPSAGKL